MAQQHIDIGVAGIVGSGEPLRSAWAKVEANFGELYGHVRQTDNPHGVTKAQVGLGNVDNTSDAAKPVSTATATALTALSTALSSQITSGATAAVSAAFGSLTGDVTAFGYAITIKPRIVTNDKLAQIPPGRIKGNPTAVPGDAQDATLSAFLDFLSSAQGALLVRGQTAWSALSAGSVGQVLTVGTNGPLWAVPPAGSGGSGGGSSSINAGLYEFVAQTSGAQTLTLPQAPGSYVDVRINGLTQPTSGVTVNGSTVTLDASLDVRAGDALAVAYSTAFSGSAGASDAVRLANLIVGEVPSGALNGTNATFTLAFTPASGTLLLFRNGQMLGLGASGDYTQSGATLTLASPPSANETLSACYVKAS